MNYGIIIKVLGNILEVEAILMIPSLLVSLYYNEYDINSFIISIILIGITGIILSKKTVYKKSIKTKEGLAIVALGWILCSLFGSLPFIISGSIPSWIDSFFETVSGLTTTGATLIDNVEILPKGILFWRSFTHWIGGMGILVFTVALLPTIGVGGFQIFKAESPGPTAERIVPRIKNTAKILYITYISITVLEIVFLRIGGMSLYESTVHTFATVGTGGFSTKNSSIGAFNSTYIHIIISIFMLLSGVSFSLYYALFNRKWKDIFKNEELKLYLGIVLSSVTLIALNINSKIYHNIGLSFRDSLFQVSSIITTTGYSTVNFDEWPTFSKSILFLLMFVGGCAGSTSGGIKNIRLLVLAKLVRREFRKIFHPRAVVPIKNRERAIPNDVVASISSFFILYIAIFALGTILISLEGINFESAASATASMLGNVGPGFGFVGPTCTYSNFSALSKLFLSLLMLLGRLELFTIMALFVPTTFKNNFDS
ncbi:TrkH family potassium uptake protein [Clostridium cochlearium]|uniref:Potassium uptake protein trkH n=1 Tax=Clostridium cochlearium TaxID=1494 RepID=A0A239YXR6_CLOCO|nr:TrkH family potassium uptake protein [Clostridium cochlearium]MBU5269978.1 TrkH family potassium uptake protein [Clostridium cochlearium]SDL27385.1 trk system potassium uptake protein TrkH [Clostridium cochlearium]SNV63695.1 potassium uptake protein trkH [Clostridium cochlearium]SQB34056.1 potassium uptake protein trkH [Clostridium cochlearium]STA91322.1 potassium uptake protein trkH [Clostridium cochlearium]